MNYLVTLKNIAPYRGETSTFWVRGEDMEQALKNAKTLIHITKLGEDVRDYRIIKIEED